MIKEELLIEVNTKNVLVTFLRKDIKKLHLRIGKYNHERDTFDLIISMPKYCKVKDALDFFYRNLDWYLNETSIERNLILPPGMMYLNGRLVLEEDFLKNSISTFEHIKDMFYKRLPEFNIKNINLTFKKLKSRWGSYNRNTNTVTLNYYLVMVSDMDIDYVICHELTHTLVFDHSKKFYSELSKHYKDYKNAKEDLKHYGVYLR